MSDHVSDHVSDMRMSDMMSDWRVSQSPLPVNRIKPVPHPSSGHRRRHRRTPPARYGGGRGLSAGVCAQRGVVAGLGGAGLGA